MANRCTQGKKKELSSQWTTFVKTKIHRPLLSLLHWITRNAAVHPLVTIAVVSIFSLASLAAGFFTNFNMDVDTDLLWTPVGSYSAEHFKWMTQESGIAGHYLFFAVLFHRNGENVLGKDLMMRMFDVLEMIQISPGYDEMCKESPYFDLALNTSTCEVMGPTRFWNNSRSVFLDTVDSDEDVIDAFSKITSADGMPFAHSLFFGKAEKTEDIMSSAESAFMYVGYPDAGQVKDEWEEAAVKGVLDFKEQLHDEGIFSIDLIADGSLEKEFVRAIMQDLPLAIGVFLVMSAFTALVFTNFRRPRRSRTMLGIAAVVSVLLSLLCGFGIMFVIGVPFTSLTQLVPFMVVGVGLDDSFIIMGSFERIEGKLTVTEKIALTTEDIGISIVTTTLTSALAFGLGCLSSVPAVFWLCQYCCPIIVLVLLFQLTFFVACVALDERRKQGQLPSEVQGDTDEPGKTTAYVMEKYAGILLAPLTKVVVIALFLGLFLTSCFSVYGMKQSFSLTDVLPKVSYVVDYIENTRLFYQSEFTGVDLYFRDVDHSDQKVREQMRNYTKAFHQLDNYMPQTGKPFWLDALDVFLMFRPNAKTNTFEQNLDDFLSDPVYKSIYGNDIVRNELGQVEVSRTSIVLLVNFDDVHDQIDTLKRQQQITEAQEINDDSGNFKFFAYAEIFNIWEFYARAVSELISTTALGVSAVSLVALLFIPHYSAVLFTFPLVCILYADLLGFMRWFGVSINALSYICLTLSIGLMVDFLLHVLVRFYEVKGTRRERTVEMLRTMGSSIIQGGTTTFLGILLLAFSSSAAFTTIFVIFIGIIVLGVGHGLILLPVLLDLIGPINDESDGADSCREPKSIAGNSDIITIETGEADEKMPPSIDDLESEVSELSKEFDDEDEDSQSLHI